MLLSVLTTPRPGGASYVQQTLDWIDDQSTGLDLEKFLICDSVPVRRVGWTTVRVKNELSLHGLPANKFAGWGALQLAVEHEQDLIFFEDDVVPLSSTALDTMATSSMLDDAAWLSFFHPTQPAGVYPRHSFMYCQALRLPLKTCQWLLCLPKIVPGDWESVRGFDEALASVDRPACRLYQQTDPLVRHVGVVSACRHPSLQ